MTGILDHAKKAKSLPCDIGPHWLVPSLDFKLRFVVGYELVCEFGKVQSSAPLVAFVRVKPRGATDVVLVEVFDLATVSPEKLPPVGFRKSVNMFMAGSFAVGVGEYSVELVLTDQHARTCRKDWHFKAGTTGDARNLPLALKPNAVEPLLIEPWDGKLDSNGLRLTVLINAAPWSRGGIKMRGWDRAVLLESLSTLLRQLPCRSVRVVAFSLDTQVEIFRADQFDRKEFGRLSNALERLQVGAVSYQALEATPWQKHLLRLTKQEISDPTPPDALVFLGAKSRFDSELPPEMLTAVQGSRVPAFYFKFFPYSISPDGIQRLTKSMHGTTFEVYSPNDLGHAVEKMRVQVRPPQTVPR